MLDLVFCLHVRRYPSNPVAWFVGEEGSINDQIVVSTVVGKEVTVLVHHSKAMLSHHLFKAGVIAANLCIQIPHSNGEILLVTFPHGFL